MIGFWIIIGSMLAANVGWWVWARRRLRQRRGLRIAVGVFLAVPVLFLVGMMLVPDFARRMHQFVPMPVVALAYLWNLLILPLALIFIGAAAALRLLPCRSRETSPDRTSRRLFLGSVAAVAPPLLASGGVAFGLQRINDFRLRRFEIKVPSLPAALDGLTIAHVSDLHTGKFTTPESVERIVDEVNGLRADLVLFTGDLIDLSMADLPLALEILGRLEPQSRLFLCEGNHDLIDDGRAFRRGVREAGFRLLLNEGAVVEVRGERVQVLGVKWARGEERRSREMGKVRALVQPDCFPILLAHHPHCFDDAGEIPLTLAGHTHGGLLMINDQVGPGPLLYKYWSGLYEQGGRSIVVSNGVGNWFPLRTSAPAEIGLLTLRV